MPISRFCVRCSKALITRGTRWCSRACWDADRRKLAVKAYRWRDGGRLHRVRAERALGKPLPLGAVVHHADGSKDDDAPLVICQDETYHRLLHRLLRIHQAGGNPFTDRICFKCRRVLPFAAFSMRDPNMRRLPRCHECNREHVRVYTIRRREREAVAS